MEANLANISNKMWRGIAPKGSALQIDLEMTQQEVRSLEPSTLRLRRHRVFIL
jgi:hypothetical protein